MFGAPDREDLDLDVLTDSDRSRWLAVLHQDSEEEGWPYGGDPGVIFFLNERVSPSRMRLMDFRFIFPLLLTLLFHVFLILQLRSDSMLAALVAAANEQPRPKQEEEITPFYLVEMPEQREEKASRQRAPLSDMNRRAHGGEGDPADRPASRGNTEELRLSPPAGMPGMAGAQGTDTQGNDRKRGDPAQDPKDADGQDAAQKLADGSSAVLAIPKPQEGGSQGSGRLRGLSGVGVPGSGSGYAPNRTGGRVDVGPLAFDTEWYEWGPYAAEMLRRIRYHWDIPEIARLGVGGVVRIRFYIERNGRVTGLEIESESGHPSMDFAARDAILNASPLPPLPPDLTGVDREGVTITFYYNTPVPDYGESG